MRIYVSLLLATIRSALRGPTNLAVVRWQRSAWRRYWTRKSKRGPGRPRLPKEVRDLIQRLARENPRWGSIRIQGELRKLGYHVSSRSVRRYRKVPTRRPPSQSWRTFLSNHAPHLWAADFLTVQTVGMRMPVDVHWDDQWGGVVSIAGGEGFTCGLTTAGAVKCWGNNESGQLGNGSTTESATPVDVTGLASGVVRIAAGGSHACALTGDGALKCWGNNGRGQLGDGTGTNSSTPVEVVGMGSGVAGVVAGLVHTCAWTMAGDASCWGRNLEGQLGDGTTTDRLTPVGVVGLVGATRMAP